MEKKFHIVSYVTGETGFVYFQNSSQEGDSIKNISKRYRGFHGKVIFAVRVYYFARREEHKK